MIRFILAFFALVAATIAPAAAQPAQLPTRQEAVFAGGCFWCMESDMGAIPGVISVMSGYTGGTLRNPAYEDVLTERTGHYEAVRVVFDPSVITYRQLVDRYWRLIDPTDNGGQFCDRGPSYRAAIFVTPAQRPDATASRDAVIASNRVRGRVVTAILPLARFYEAEEYHRNYARRNPERYAAYRAGCGRTARLRQVWGG
ncbi:peptide methionine sulfoxide reductase MsrA [alpha proteobacterium U9-1i]|nr:peptide methionine sulfoxide reductase MsrA [alpha proteobacterium U9-1i]